MPLPISVPVLGELERELNNINRILTNHVISALAIATPKKSRRGDRRVASGD